VTEIQTICLVSIVVIVMRIPRIVERWKAPLLRGAEWFFNVQVGPDFLRGPGAAILRNYRLLLFLPWAIEVPIALALVYTNHNQAVLWLLLCVTALTRVNYYAARTLAEKRAQPFNISSPSKPVSAIALSLAPRSLRDYTNPWVEALIVTALAGSLAWLGYRYSVTQAWNAVRGPFAVTIFCIYLQLGLLLVKRACIRARSAAPADNPEQYLAWRDSLRRLAAATCDYMRLAVLITPLTVDVQSVTYSWQGSTAKTVSIFIIVAAGFLGTWYEWRHRLRYLQVTRETPPARFLVLPDVKDASRFLCFRPSLPVLLLNGPKGYTLNLASAPARIAGLYAAGCAALWICLVR
jgi:hypothetical protein